MWLGATGNTNSMVFEVPPAVEVKQADRDGGARRGYVSTDAVSYTSLGNTCWYTNIPHGRRCEPLQLMTQADNKRFNKRIANNARSYKTYDNHDAIEVPVTNGIPSDYKGVMGVPVSFLAKYCPKQFEIVGCSYAHGRPEGWDPAVPMKVMIEGAEVYDRLFIRHIAEERG